MNKIIKTMLVVSACMFIVPISVCASDTLEGQVIDGSVLTNSDKSEVTELFDWNFDDEEGIMPFGSYYAFGSCGIAKQSSRSVYISATTECYVKCNTVKVEVTLQQLKNSTWNFVTSRSKTEKNAYNSTARDTINVQPGYYYRTVSFHSATKNGKTETGVATGKGIYIG